MLQGRRQAASAANTGQMWSLGGQKSNAYFLFPTPLSKFPTFFKLLAWHTLHLKLEGGCSGRHRITVGNEVTEVPCPRAFGEHLS